MNHSPRGLPLDVSDVVIAFPSAGGGRRTILSVARWSVDAGARMALCGPSGSGKTSLLHVLCGIDRPAAGSVRWGPTDIAAARPVAADRWRRAMLGLVFQHFHLFPGLSALENVVLPARFEHFSVPPQLRERAISLLRRVGIAPAALVESLSRGEMQRVAIARALIREPAVVLADEPTASLDRDTAEAVADLLVEVCSENGATLIVGTHDASLAARMLARVDIAHGELQRDALPA
jgi:putative ABC transport system ATP-binding protein